MAVKFTVEIIQEEKEPRLFIASSEDASGSDDVVFIGNGATPYEALHDLINEFENAELYRADEE